MVSNAGKMHRLATKVVPASNAAKPNPFKAYLNMKCAPDPRNSLYIMVNTDNAMLANIASLLYAKESTQHIGINVQRRMIASRRVILPAGRGLSGLFVSSSSEAV
jgi:hypothetical protein